MDPYEPRLKSLAMQLGIPFTVDGFPEFLPFNSGRSTQDIGLWSEAHLIESSLHFKDIDERRRALTKVTKSIEEWLQILGKNDRRIRILWAMHTVANAIIEGNQAPTEEELGLTKSDPTPSQSPAEPIQKNMKTIGHSFVVVTKADVLKKNFSFLLDFIKSISLPQIKSGDVNYAKMAIAINGYDNDARPLWDIPEVVEWYRELHSKHPYMPLFLTPGSVQVYFQVLRPIAYSIIPEEFRDKKDLTGLLLHTFSERNKYFSAALGSDYYRCKSILSAADKSVADAVTNLANGIEEPF